MRVLVALLTALVGFAGCLADEPGPEDPVEFPLEVYRFSYEGSDTFVAGVEHGWMVRVHNPSEESHLVSVIASGIASGVIGPISDTGGPNPQTAWLPGRIEDNQFGSAIELAAGESALYLARVSEYQVADAGAALVNLRVLAQPADTEDGIVSRETISWTVDLLPETTPVAPGDHVQTVTVGVWLNGTSFYSNAAGALQDGGFPHGPGWTSATDDTTPLPIYVFNQNRDEQPAGSQDRCHFTTITGYNGLLKTQAEGSTNVALLRPEAAYTAEGREDHPLFGDFLVFMNTIVAHDGATTTTDEAPDPSGACFSDRVDNVLGSTDSRQV